MVLSFNSLCNYTLEFHSGVDCLSFLNTSTPIYHFFLPRLYMLNSDPTLLLYSYMWSIRMQPARLLRNVVPSVSIFCPVGLFDDKYSKLYIKMEQPLLCRIKQRKKWLLKTCMRDHDRSFHFTFAFAIFSLMQDAPSQGKVL